MAQWYRKKITKGILILAVILFSATAVLMLTAAWTFSGSLAESDIFGNAPEKYKDSKAFEAKMRDASADILYQISLKEQFETDGKYDPDKLVDVVRYEEDHTVTGTNESGLAYSLKDLAEWGKSSDSQETGKEDVVVVCKKPDGSYRYYYQKDFEALVQNKSLTFSNQGKNVTEEILLSDILSFLQGGQTLHDLGNEYGYGQIGLDDEKGQEIYTNCWYLHEFLPDGYEADGYGDILNAFNQDEKLNGRFQEVCSELSSMASSIAYDLSGYTSAGDTWTEGNTNLTYIYKDSSGKQIYTNNTEYQNYSVADQSIKKMTGGKSIKYVIVRPKLKEFSSNLDVSASEWKTLVNSNFPVGGKDWVFAVAVNTAFPVQDIFYESAKAYDQYVPWLRLSGVWLVSSAAAVLTALVWLTAVAGRRDGDDRLYLNGFDRWKTELGGGSVILLWILATFTFGRSGVGFGTYTVSMSNESYMTFSVTTGEVVVVAIYTAVSAGLFLIGYLSLVRRIKAGNLWKNSLLRWILLGMREFWKNRNIYFRSAVAFLAFIALHWIACIAQSHGGSLFWVLMMLAAEGVAFYLVLRHALAKAKIRKGISQIASGNVSYRIPLEHMTGESKEMAEEVNDIGNGLNRAVEEGMRSERLKADLITNVSHDIKTPLTSIINYVDLLKRENISDPKIQGYLDILEAKSQRLKTLTEDVVEASKVSSGNISLEYMNLDLGQMLQQTVGEFTEKMEARNLTVVLSLPEEPAMIYADGRRMWRVLENIFNNAAKYAMPGTRIYGDLKKEEGKVVLSLKNVSEQQLNISADELTERFIRGDISRSTEGSGLGLSIAKNLTTMQGGEFQLYLDGDLFKVTITFPEKK